MNRRYFVTTFGCQMNAHDSERIKGLLEELGLGEAAAPDEADVLVLNTCTIREKPDTRFAAHMGNAAKLKRERPGTVIAVGGCYAEAQRERLFELYPDVDVAFGPGTISHLGGEISRRPGEILAELQRLAEEGVCEVTLLGQNVNSYGRDVGSSFAELLRAVDSVPGIERIRFTSPHPKDFCRDVIAAMAECAAVCEHAHLPLQSGSTRLLKAMRRTYSRERYLRLVDDLRAAIPDLALTTDIIVGFPGETESDFRETLEVVDEVGFDGAFTFVYSPRAGTEAAAMPDQVPDEIKRERIERLVEVVQGVAAEQNAQRVGTVEEVLVEGPSRTEAQLLRGRTRRNTTVIFSGDAAPGELVPVEIAAATSTTLSGTHLAAAAV